MGDASRRSPERSSRAPAARDAAARVVRIGVSVFLGSACLALLPLLLLGSGWLNKYLVAFGLIGACLGGSIALHGAWDWAHGRGGRTH